MSKKQLELNLYKGRRGGRRPGSGRKRLHSRGVAHRKREKVVARTPLHINFKFRTFIRNKSCLQLLKRAILNAGKQGLLVMHFSLQSNHVHLIVEAVNNRVLESGMRALTVTFARGLAKGKIQLERYHLHVLKSLNETKNAILYVLFNQQKHNRSRVSRIDAYSSLTVIPNALRLIRNYGMKARVTFILEKNVVNEGLLIGQSYLLMQAMRELTCLKKMAF